MPERPRSREGRPPSAAEAAGRAGGDRGEPGSEASEVGGATEPGSEAGEGERPDPMRAAHERAEERNRAAREALSPLEPGERPGPVTAGAILSGLVALIFWASAATAIATDTTVNGERPEPVQLSVFAVVTTVMALGMWKARYWAVLGFQMLLVLFLLAAVFGLIIAESLLQAVATTALIAGLGYLFYKMVKSLARIQMPRGPGSR